MITNQKVNKFINLDSRFRGNDIRRNRNDREWGMTNKSKVIIKLKFT